MDFKIAVIVTSAQPGIILDCLTALSVQDIEKSAFEVIVVGRPQDETSFSLLTGWTEKRKMNITFLYTTHGGTAAARRLGCSHAKAPLLAFTDAHCMPHKSWLSTLLKEWRQGEITVYSGQIRVPVTRKPGDWEFSTARLENVVFSLTNFACPTAAIMLAGGFDDDFKDTWHEGLAFYFSLRSAGIPVVQLPQAIVVYPLRGQKWGTALQEQWKVSEDALLSKKHPALYSKHTSFTPAFYYYFTILCWIASASAVYTNHDKAIQISLSSLACCIIFLLFRGLSGTRKSLVLFIEQLINAIYIPFLFLYWKTIGTIKHRRIACNSLSYQCDRNKKNSDTQ